MPDGPDRPTVSVVIPCFNQARFLAAAVDSVRSQRSPGLECIVVNDGSTDDTAVVAAALGVRVVEQANRGLSEARNAGLAAARGDLVVFLDADDELLPDAIERGATALASDPIPAAVVGRCQVMDAAGSPLPAVHADVDRSNLYEEWLSRNFVWTPGAAMFRRRALEEIGGFPPGLGPAADYAVYLRLARTGLVRLVGDDVVRYRQHQAGMSRDPALMLRATLAVLRRESHEAPPSRRRLVRRGRERWCEWYGEQIVDRLRTDWRAHRRGVVQVRAAALLVRHCPRVAARHVARKARRVLASLARRTQSALLKLAAPRGRRVAP
jgi:glycosyltransferase involved in cell wall biosynthesis